MILKIFSQVQIVKGYNRSCVYDLQRGDYDLISNRFASLLLEINGKEINSSDILFDKYQREIQKAVDKEYIYFVENDLAKQLNEIDFIYKSPSKVTNAVLDVECECSLRHVKTLEDVGCKHILIRILSFIELHILIYWLKKYLTNLTFRHIEIEFMFDFPNLMLFTDLLRQEQLPILDIRHASEDKSESFKPTFIINMEVYKEAKEFNVFYNKKLYIDSDGNYKTSLKANKVFESEKFQLEKAIQKFDFTELWSTNKDKCSVCNSCEFRYMCIDNRIPVATTNVEELRYMEECSYNPFISKWSDEEGYISFAKLGDYLKTGEFIPNHNLIKKLNKKLWYIS